MGLTDTIADYLRETVLTKHSQRLGRSHCGIDAQRRGIKLMIAMGVAVPAAGGDAWDLPNATAWYPADWTQDDLASVVVGLAYQRRRLKFSGASDGWAAIGPAHGLHGAVTDPQTMAVLIAIGFVADGSWTEAAAEVVQKTVPYEWLRVAGGGS